ncbi:vacuolar protein sorting-associated protein 60 [Cantharellus anzutake]|uniref:vacuolar protein sorting-associated protein 60 n=1 Tax=Cantharellus anzutake TaxID=1750568 RepID=UPI0019038C68|nr:vacuolar protein sorting-associated protein 60 [Cantharellus anzutake]KAF8332674.1 vacuolar protein sorting-associated protein 60 [Cantharellus anzutake]
MNRIFGSSASKAPKPSLSDAIASTDQRAASVEVKIAKLDAELVRYRDQMAKMRNGPGKNAVQERALRVLRQKKMYEAQLAQLTQQSYNMESAALATENLRNTMATVDAMKTANKEIRKQYGKIDVDKLESMHDEMSDLLEQANEIQETMGRSYAVPDEIDEADLEAELQALDVETEEDPSAYLDTVPDFLDEAPIAEPKESQKAAVTNT